MTRVKQSTILMSRLMWKVRQDEARMARARKKASYKPSRRDHKRLSLNRW